ncbi:MAG TPA: NAD(P)-dependent oxidoreductase, partial [Bacillota bacterium]
VHLPERDDTRGYLNEERLRLLPPGALVVNTGRGAVIDEAALARLIQAGHLGGAALDVRAQEPPPEPDPLVACGSRVILTPHVAGLTPAAQLRVSLQVAADVRRVLAGLPPLRPAPPAPA